MKTESIWRKTSDIEVRTAVCSNKNAGIVIIGAGMAGLLTAYLLKQKGKNCIVLEENRIGSGQTQNTTAKVTSQHNLIYHKITEKIGAKEAYSYAEANEKAIKLYEEIIQNLGIRCDWVRCPAFLYTTGDDKEIRKEYEAAVSAGLPASLTTDTELPFSVSAALRFEEQARFHPLRFLAEIAKEVTVYEHTRVTEIREGHILITNRGEIMADQIIFACHYPFLNTPGYYFMRMHQERSYAISVTGAKEMEGIYLGTDDQGLSFRSFEDSLIIGGGSHRTGQNEAGGKYDYLGIMASRYWPDCEETARWSAQDCITLDGIPYIGKFSAATPDWYIATGFGKWGMSSSMVSAMILSDQICNIENKYEKVFSPHRMNVQASAANLLKDGVQASKGLLKQKFTVPDEVLKDVKTGEGKTIEYKEEKIGVYKEQKGKVYIVSVKCPHLGCELTWNPDEKSWDCPCHGSRFDYKGNRLEGPAQLSIKKNE